MKKQRRRRYVHTPTPICAKPDRIACCGLGSSRVSIPTGVALEEELRARIGLTFIPFGNRGEEFDKVLRFIGWNSV